jgi:hypothetical protein
MAPTKNHRSKKPSSSDELRPEEREEMDNEEEGMEVLEENGCCEPKKCCNESGKKKCREGSGGWPMTKDTRIAVENLL